MKFVGGSVVHHVSSSTLLAVSFFCMVATSRILSVTSFLTPIVPAAVAARHDASWKKPSNILKTTNDPFTVSSRTATTTVSAKSLSRINRATLDVDDQRHDGPRRRSRLFDDSSLALFFPVVLPTSMSFCSSTIQLVLGHVLGGLLGLPFVAQAIPTWYRKIDLPRWTPPNQIFGPVWTLLYASMGWALSIVLSKLTATTTTTTTAGIVLSKNNVLALWAVHYGLNLVWAPVFFGFQRLRLGLVISYAMVFTLLAVMKVYHSVVPRAAYLLIPYLCWITFATALNQAICRRNPMCENGKTNKAMRLAQLAKLQKKKQKSENR